MQHHDESLDHLRHSAAHLLAAAVMELWPGTKRTIGPAIEDGFYYDFEFPEPISENNLPKIEKRMRQILTTWGEGFVRTEVTADEARAAYAGNPYKLELINEFSKDGQTLTFYTSGKYSDLCRGGHCEHPKEELRHFKLLSVAGAYWRGSEKNPMLTRIYGTAFKSAEELEAHLKMREEAKLRDHRKIGRDQKLYFIDDVVGKGLVMWLPNGTALRNEIEGLAVEMERRGGYIRVVTPHMAKEELFLTSGHLPYYKDGMYPPMVMDDGTYYLKAMNCPHHHRIYLHEPHSYRDLPIRMAEYGTVYRNELSGTLQGLLRVRGLAMNDAHIYCRKDQIKDEFKAVMDLTRRYFEAFGLKDYWFRLSKWSPEHKEKYIDEPENWAYAEGVLREVLQEADVPFVEAEDEAAFYGPKVDVQFKSVVGREETMSTIQLDFVARKRFGLSYTDETGAENGEVFVVHRAPLSTHERFTAFLIEHYAGAFPLWLAPVQVRVAAVGEAHREAVQGLVASLGNLGVRAEADVSDATVGAKIRSASKMKIPYTVVFGDKEKDGSDFHVRVFGQEAPLVVAQQEFAGHLLAEIKRQRGV